MGLLGQSGIAEYPSAPRINLSAFEQPQAIATWQAATIVALLNKIDRLAQDVADNEAYLCAQVDPETQMIPLEEDDDDEDNLDRERDDLLEQVAYLLTSVVACTGLPNVLLPYDQSESLTFDNRPNPKFSRSAAAIMLSNSD